LTPSPFFLYPNLFCTYFFFLSTDSPLIGIARPPFPMSCMPLPAPRSFIFPFSVLTVLGSCDLVRPFFNEFPFYVVLMPHFFYASVLTTSTALCLFPFFIYRFAYWRFYSGRSSLLSHVLNVPPRTRNLPLLFLAQSKVLPVPRETLCPPFVVTSKVLSLLFAYSFRFTLLFFRGALLIGRISAGISCVTLGLALLRYKATSIFFYTRPFRFHYTFPISVITRQQLLQTFELFCSPLLLLLFCFFPLLMYSTTIAFFNLHVFLFLFFAPLPPIFSKNFLSLTQFNRSIAYCTISFSSLHIFRCTLYSPPCRV